MTVDFNRLVKSAAAPRLLQFRPIINWLAKQLILVKILPFQMISTILLFSSLASTTVAMEKPFINICLKEKIANGVAGQKTQPQLMLISGQGNINSRFVVKGRTLSQPLFTLCLLSCTSLVSQSNIHKRLCNIDTLTSVFLQCLL